MNSLKHEIIVSLPSCILKGEPAMRNCDAPLQNGSKYYDVVFQYVKMVQRHYNTAEFPGIREMGAYLVGKHVHVLAFKFKVMCLLSLQSTAIPYVAGSLQVPRPDCPLTSIGEPEVSA
jgi:hypothetical protein